MDSCRFHNAAGILLKERVFPPGPFHDRVERGQVRHLVQLRASLDKIVTGHLPKPILDFLARLSRAVQRLGHHLDFGVGIFGLGPGAECGSALHDRLVEEALGFPGKHVVVDGGGSGGFSEEGDVLRVTSESGNVLFDPG